MTKIEEWGKCSSLINKEFGGKLLWHCNFLNGKQLAVTPGFLRACGSATHGKESPSICSYLEPDVNPISFLSGLGTLIKANQTENGPCAGCRYLRQVKVPHYFVSDFISAISLHDFSGCNSKCVYCKGNEYYLPEDYVATFDHTILFRNLLEAKLIRPGHTSIGWGGGEPTLLNTFEKTVDLLRVNGIHQVINTSGIHFSPATERALRDRQARVRISVDSGTNETYAKVKRNPYCDNAWESAQRYAATKGDFILKYIVFPMNSDVGEVDDFVKRAHKAGVKKICISVDARLVYEGFSANNGLSQRELTAASFLYNIAKSMKIQPYFESLWPLRYIKQIEEIGHFKISPSLLSLEFGKQVIFLMYLLSIQKIRTWVASRNILKRSICEDR